VEGKSNAMTSNRFMTIILLADYRRGHTLISFLSMLRRRT